MKICFIASVYPRSEDDLEVPWLRKTVNLLREEGHDVKIFVPSFRGLKSHTIDGTPVKRFRYFLSNFETLTHDEGAPNKIHKFHYKIITLFYILSGMIQLAIFHRREKFDVLHVHWPFPHGIFAFFAKIFCKTKIVLSFYTASLMLVKRFPFVKTFLKFFIKNSDDVIAISTFASTLAKDIYEKDMAIIPYGTTISPKNEIDHLEPTHKILSVGRMVERKGFKYLIDAMPIILKKYPDATLTIAGGGAIRDELLKQVNELNLNDSVSLPGKVSQDELEKLFAECNTFILPSIIDSKGDTEGLGVVLIEAMSYKKPVIGTNIGGIVDIVVDNESGLLVEQKSPEEIADATDKLFSDNDFAEKLGQKGYDYIEREFSWESVINKFNKVYKGLGINE